GVIGGAVRTRRPDAPGQVVAIVGGQPSLGRHCVFGQLFAVAGPGGPVYRIDRHPTMSRHPVSPMQEADLRIHLGRQGLEGIALVDLRSYAQAPETLDAMVDAWRRDAGAADAPTVLFDVAEEAHLALVGRVIWQQAQRAQLL